MNHSATAGLYASAIADIFQKEFRTTPGRIEKMGNGICNEVYSVGLGDRDVMVRLNTHERYLTGTRDHLPIFRSKGIRVAEILAEDYSKNNVPFAYHVLTKLDGRDINDVIHTLNDGELRAIAAEISNIFNRLSEVPNNGKFGYQWGDDLDLKDSWADDIARMTAVTLGWGAKTGVLDVQLEQILTWINAEYRPYFESVIPMTYFGDICAKNVLIHEGRFSGLVDLDCLAQGDPLEAIGRIKASWHGTHYGKVYTDAVMDVQQLDDQQRKIVTMYALLNRTYWTFENGVQFNQNTTPVVDREKEKHDKVIVQSLFDELRGS